MIAGVQLNGIDPHTKREQAAQVPKNTFDAIIHDWTGWQERQGIRTAMRNRRQHELHTKTRFGTRDANTISRKEIIEAVEKIAEEVGGTQSVRVQAMISAAMQWAVDADRITVNPAARIRKQTKEKARDRKATDDEIGRIWAATFVMAPQIGRVIRLLIATGQRRSEICKSERVELSPIELVPGFVRPGGYTKKAALALTIPERRLKNKQPFHIVPLSPLAQREFIAACAVSAWSPYVFQARKLKASPMNETTPSAMFADTMRALGIWDLRLHDLRHVCATGMASVGVPPHVRELVQNQVTGRSRTMGGRYDQHDYTMEKLRALRLWALRLQEIVRGRKPRGLHW